MPARGHAFLFFALAVFAVGAGAATYVSDQLSINLRRGPGNEYRITQLLESGTRVNVLEESDGWTKVRTEGGVEGFVLSRFLTDQPAARERLASMQERVSELESTNEELEAELASALEGSSELGKLKRELVAENEELKSELADIKEASTNAIRLREENQRFREKILSMESEVERLRHENKALQSRRDGMKVGAMILVGGIVLGLILPMFRRRSRNSWDSL